MDELWQRYRSFWTPLLIGLGVFLVGLILVHALTKDPDVVTAKVRSQSGKVKKKVKPSKSQILALRQSRDVLDGRVEAWSRRIDQAQLQNPVDAVVSDALKAALLRGVDPDVLREAAASPSLGRNPQILEVFDGDDVAAAKALARYELIRIDRLALLESGDANVGFSRLLNDVWAELRVRANRADLELRTDVLGFGAVTSVTRQVLAQRLLNLARIAELVDLAIRSGVRAILEVRLEQKLNPLGDEVFLREWPFTISMRGNLASLRPIISYFTDPEHPVPLTHFAIAQPSRGSPLEGEAQLTAKAASVLVRPEASLGLDLEEDR